MTKLKCVLAAVAAMVVSFANASPAYQATLTVAGYAGESTLADFPVLVRISSERITGFDYSQCAAEGADISFADADGNVLSHEIDTWNTSGESLVWVKIPSLAGTTTSFKLRWGDLGATESTSSSNAWNAAYVGVWHMGEESGNCANSSQCGSKYDATPAGNTANSVRYTGDDAPVGFARTAATSAAKGYLSVPSYDAESVGGVFTMSGWVRLDSVSGYTRFFSRKANYNDANGWEMAMNNNSYTKFDARGIKNDRGIDGGALPSMQTTWVHVAFVYDGATLTVYGNGGETVASGTIDAATDNAQPLSLGCDSDGNEGWMRGQFDECRLMKGAASADWVKAEYDTVKADGFIAYGEAEAADEDATLSAVWAADVATTKHVATVSARVLALGGGATSAAVSVRYGTSGDALSQTVELAAAAGKGETVSATLADLLPGTTYYAKLVAKNNKGDEFEGDVVSFKTDSYLSNVALDGDGGDAIVVTGTLDAFDGSCALKVLTISSDGETATTNEWTNLDGSAPAASDASQPFTLKVCETDKNAARIVPGATYDVVVVATIGEWTMVTPAVSVTTKSAKPTWKSSSLSCPRRSVSLDGYLSEVGMKGATTVTLYLGETTAYECCTNVVSADMATGHYAFFSDKPYKMPNFDRTCCWKLVAENVSEGGTATNTITASGTFQTKDATIYTWTGRGDGSWNDANGWSAEEAYADDCLGCPTSVNATVVFEAGTTNVITLSTPVRVAALSLAAANLDVTFKAAEVDGLVVTTNDAKITATSVDYNGANGALTLDGVALRDTAGGWERVVGAGFAITLLNGADLYVTPEYFSSYYGGKLTLRGHSNFSCADYWCGNDIEIEDATLTVRGGHVYGTHARTTHAIDFRGKCPRYVGIHGMISGVDYMTPVVNFNFYVPEGGYAIAPVYSPSTATYPGPLGWYRWKDTALATFNMNVMADSPAKKAGRKLETTLVEWPAPGISTTVVKEGTKPSKSDVFVWSEELVSDLYPKSLGVKFTNGPGLLLIIR